MANEDSLRTQPLPPLEPAPAPISAAPPAMAPGFWVQLGAFGRPEGAQQLQQQATRELQSLAPLLGVYNERGLNRLQAGPFESREAALRAAAQIRAGLQIAPVIVERR
jgi:rare lipoprotein A